MRRQGPPPPGSRGVCYTCGQPGHIARNCTAVGCYRCQQLGHVSRNCPAPHGSPRPQFGRATGAGQNQKQSVGHSLSLGSSQRVQGTSQPPGSVRATQGTGQSQGSIQTAQVASQSQASRQTAEGIGQLQGSIQTAQGTSRPLSSVQTAQGTSQPLSSVQTAQGTYQPQTPVDVAENFWLQSVHDWYPNLHSQAYFFPPLHFNRVQHDVQTVSGLPVLVPQQASDQAGQVPVSVPRGPPPQLNPPPLASQLYQPVPPGDPLSPVCDSDVREDHALQQVLQRLQQLADRRQEVMMVLSQLQFRKYLDNQVDPITAAATRLLPRPATLGIPKGDFDVLVISPKYGLIVGEVKAVGADPQHTTDQAVVAKVMRAVKQLNTAHNLLGRLVSDLGPITITKILMLPNVTTEQLVQAIDTNPQVQQDLCQCFGATDTAAAVARCLCASNSDDWWGRSVTDHGQDITMSPQLYERLVARFCGPTTSVEVPTVSTPRRFVELRTLAEAIAHTGLRLVTLALYVEQVDLLNRPGLEQVFLWGPPGTGKTITLYLKALQWRRRGKDVHLLSSHKLSRSAIFLLEHQLLHAPSDGPTAASAAAPRVHRHMYDFEYNDGDMEIAANQLAAAAKGGELYIIADEAFSGYGQSSRFFDFVTRLSAQLPFTFHLWAAAVERVQVPPSFHVERLTRNLRCPPAVARQVARADEMDDVKVPKYSSSSVTPAPTDGPAVMELPHDTWATDTDGGGTRLPGHKRYRPEDCEKCAEGATDLLEELRVGQSGQDLQYRDVIVLCYEPRENLPLISRLRARGFPVEVVTSDDDEAAIRDVAVAARDVVTVTDYKVSTGLERRIVVGLGSAWTGVAPSRLREMSRSTSLLIYVGPPLEPSREAHFAQVSANGIVTW